MLGQRVDNYWANHNLTLQQKSSEFLAQSENHLSQVSLPVLAIWSWQWRPGFILPFPSCFSPSSSRRQHFLVHSSSILPNNSHIFRKTIYHLILLSPFLPFSPTPHPGDVLSLFLPCRSFPCNSGDVITISPIPCSSFLPSWFLSILRCLVLTLPSCFSHTLFRRWPLGCSFLEQSL